jgi:hypothetical protein
MYPAVKTACFMPPREAPAEAVLDVAVNLSSDLGITLHHRSHVCVKTPSCGSLRPGSLTACSLSTSKLFSWYRVHATKVQARPVTGQTRSLSNIITAHQ